jgi:hypothetical protein
MKRTTPAAPPKAERRDRKARAEEAVETSLLLNFEYLTRRIL